MSSSGRNFASTALIEFKGVASLYIRLALAGGLCGVGTSIAAAFWPSVAHLLIWPVLALAVVVVAYSTSANQLSNLWTRITARRPEIVEMGMSFRDLPKAVGYLEQFAIKQAAELQILNSQMAELLTLKALCGDTQAAVQRISEGSNSLIGSISEISQNQVVLHQSLDRVAEQFEVRLNNNKELLADLSVSVNQLETQLREISNGIAELSTKVGIAQEPSTVGKKPLKRAQKERVAEKQRELFG